MNFIEFQNNFNTEKKVIAYYIKLRYKGVVTCSRCTSKNVFQRTDRLKVYGCLDCKTCFSVFKGSIFENSDTDLRKWFYAIHLFLNGKKGISALQLQREIGVTYKTAWRILKQIRIAMGNQNIKDSFKSIVEVDETYIGGKPRKGNTGRGDAVSKRGRGTFKTPVIGVIDRITKKVYAEVAQPDKNGKKLRGPQLLTVIDKVVDPKSSVIVMTDEFRSYRILKSTKHRHLHVDHQKEFSRGFIHTNNIENFWASLKRGIYGMYHRISLKYMQSYINEFCFRYNNRFEENLFEFYLTYTF